MADGQPKAFEEASGTESAQGIHISQHYHGPVNNIEQVGSAHFGSNYGSIRQSAAQIAATVAMSGFHALLNPILDASHTRNRKLSPPNSDCFPGTRIEVIHQINSWATSSLSEEPKHILWVFGYAGCGKSAIAQAVAARLVEQRRLGASFFFFRASGDRSRISRLATTIAAQIASAIDGTASRIQAVLAMYPGILESTTSPTIQFKHLVYDVLLAVTWAWHRPLGVRKPFTVIIDGLDECEDKEEVADLIRDMIQFFEQNPGTPLRFLITSRVEDHLHRRLHDASQVRLLNLVDHTSDKDITAALNAAIADAKGSRVLACEGEWLSAEDKSNLIKHIGGSFIFMTTITKFLFASPGVDGRTPAARLPLALNMNLGFDSLYKALLGDHQHFPHFSDVINTIALARQPLSIAQIADLLGIQTVEVVVVLINLHAVIQVPGDDRSPVTLWHTSLRDFLTSEGRSGPLFARPTHHQRLFLRCIDLAIHPTHSQHSPAMVYSAQYVWTHYRSFLLDADDEGKSKFNSKILSHVQTFKQAFLIAVPDDIRDEIYKAALATSEHIPHFLEIIGIMTLARQPLSVSQIAEILGIKPSDAINVLASLDSIYEVPGNEHTVIKPSHPSPLDFLEFESRSDPFFAAPKHHLLLAYWHLSRETTLADPLASSEFASLSALRHSIAQFLDSFRGDAKFLKLELGKITTHLETKFPTAFRTIAAAYFHLDHRFFGVVSEQTRWLVIDLVIQVGGGCPPTGVLENTHTWDRIRVVLDAALRYSSLGQEGLHRHLQLFHPYLLDPDRHGALVLRGMQDLVGLKASGRGLVLRSGSVL